MPKRYVHRPTTAQVVIWDGVSYGELVVFMGSAALVKFLHSLVDPQAIYVKINGDWHIVHVGHAVVKHDGTNRVQVLKPGVLEQMYKEVHGG